MANRDYFIQGTNEQTYSVGKEGIQVYRGVVDIEKLLSAGTFNTNDILRLVEFEAGTVFHFADAEIITALDFDASAGTVNFGNTIADSTDPDDYVDAQTTEAVGRFGAYVSTTPITQLVLSADGYIAIKLTGDKLSGGTNNGTGKISWMVGLTKPAKLYTSTRGEPRVYPNN